MLRRFFKRTIGNDGKFSNNKRYIVVVERVTWKCTKFKDNSICKVNVDQLRSDRLHCGMQEHCFDRQAWTKSQSDDWPVNVLLPDFVDQKQNGC